VGSGDALVSGENPYPAVRVAGSGAIAHVHAKDCGFEAGSWSGRLGKA